VTLAASSTGSGSATQDLIYLTEIRFINISGWPTGRKHISNVVVTRVSDSVVLTKGVDYDVTLGKIYGLLNIAPFSISVTYDYAVERYDLIEMDATTKALSVVQGTERDFDAADYLPVGTVGKIPVYRALVIGSTVADLLPIYQFDNGILCGGEGEMMQIRERNKKALQKVRKKLRAGDPITIAGYGDSITAIQYGSPSYTKNGVERDRAESYLSYYPADTVAAVPKFDHGDGAGAVHIHIGWNWKFKEYLEKEYNSVVTYNNYGIGGTTSAETELGGLWPARIAEPLADAPDILVLAFGQNELGSALTQGRIINIIQQFQAVGTEVIVLGSCRNQYSEFVSRYASLLYTNQALRNAALITGSAWVDTLYLVHDDFLGGMGISKNNLCGANLYNHPSIYELARFGELISIMSGL
jgi:lysophospholipase L1-like esterase